MIKKELENPQITQSLPQKNKYVCVCGNEYKYNSGLSRHNKKCIKNNKNELNNILNSDSDSDSESKPCYETNSEYENINSDLSKKDNLIEYLINENKEFKNLIMELIKKDYTNNTNNTINNVNSHK